MSEILEQQNSLLYIADIQDELLSVKFQDECELNLLTQKLLTSPLLNNKFTFRSILISIYICYLCRPNSYDTYINLFISIAKSPHNYFQSDDYINNFSNKFFIYQLFKAGFITIDSLYKKAIRQNDFRDYFFPEIKNSYPESPFLTKKEYDRMKSSIISCGYEFDEDDIQSYISKFKEFRSKGENPNPIVNSIRNDDIDRFQHLLSQTNTSIYSPINHSLFERFIFFKNETPTFIEYAAYFSSIKCFKFLYQQHQKLPESISKFAVAGGNYEIIHLIEQSQVNFSDEALMSSIRFFRPEITAYLEDTFNIERTIEDVCKSVVFYNLRSLIDSNEVIEKNPNKADSKGFTILSLASMNGDLDIVKYLITKYDQIDVNFETENGLTSLMFCSMKGHIEIVKYLTSLHQIDVNAKSRLKKWTALHYACEYGNLDVVKFLCSLEKIDINADCNANLHPIDLAVKNGFIEIIKFLSELNDLVVYDVNSSKKSIIEYSVRSKKIEVVKLALELVDDCLVNKIKVGNLVDFKNSDPLYFGHLQNAYKSAFKDDCMDIAAIFESLLFGSDSE